ncbi:hypothetical protein [Acidovorax sp. BLS4]|uniref:hypothetical protein n=1 Tax=Acidovorax sp. BLS4 TaxID=3273430 RepID=UPI002942BD09|nr:hypothetical protein [Paracidovorax avenae]WOI47694.1 hypothetical protein R1Z03_10975 [Paracidovorax avenae]
MLSYNADMPRLIAFILCIAFLVGAGASVRAGMAVAAMALLALGGYLAWTWLRLFLGPR